MARSINAAGLALLREFEGCRLDVYRDGNGNLTVGYGHKVVADDGLEFGDSISQPQANFFLVQDLETTEAEVMDLVECDLNDNQYGAVVSLTYNEGSGRLKGSTLLKKLNAQDWTGAANEFLRWVFIDGKVSEGLTRRRQAERGLFLSPVNQQTSINDLNLQGNSA